jgi:7-cyano-7-deazaguanine synthase
VPEPVARRRQGRGDDALAREERGVGQLAEGAGLTVHAPLLALSKAGIIARGAALGVDYGRTVSCYDPDDAGAACGRCDACQLRRRGFEESGIPDPTRYQAGALR